MALRTVRGEEWDLRPQCPKCGNRTSVRIGSTQINGRIGVRYCNCRKCGERFRQTFRR